MAQKKTKPVKTGAKAAVSKGTATPQPQPDQLAIPDKAKTQALQMTASISGAAQLLNITDEASCTAGTELLLTVAQLKKQVQAKRDDLVKPIKAHVAKLEELFRPAKDALETADNLLRRKVLAYRAQVAREADEKRSTLMAEAVEAQDEGDDSGAEELATEASMVVTPSRVMAAASGQVASRKVWKYEVQDVGAVPHEYWTLDDQKLRKAVTSGVRTIPGVRIFEEEALTVGGK